MNGSLRLDGLCAGYRDVSVVHEVSLTVEPHQVVTLLGSNGAGKTTTLHATVGLAQLLGGSVTFAGEPLTAGSPSSICRRGVVLVPATRAVFQSLTVRENLLIAAPERWRPRIDDAVDLFPALAQLLKRRAGLLSGGEQRMLALARAMLRRPRILLIDELSLGLAPQVVDTLLHSVRRLAVESGVGVLLVEQQVYAALGVADRGVVLSQGRVVVDDSAANVVKEMHDLETHYLGASR